MSNTHEAAPSHLSAAGELPAPPRQSFSAPVHELFERQVEMSGDAVALVCEESTLTYRDLDARANQLARQLRRLGVRTETTVCLFLERGPEMVVAILAVLKAGGAYV